MPRRELDLEPVRAEVQSGLERAEELAPGHGYVETTAGLRGLGKDFAAYVRGEAGAKVGAHVSMFGFGEADWASPSAPPAWQAGLGARVTW